MISYMQKILWNSARMIWFKDDRINNYIKSNVVDGRWTDLV